MSIQRTAITSAGSSGKRVGLLALGIFMICLGGTYSFANPDGWFLFSGYLSCLIVSVPMLHSQYKLVSTWTPLALFVYIGSGVRSTYIAFNIDGSRTINDLFLLGDNVDSFVRPNVIYLAGITALTLGYGLYLSTQSKRVSKAYNLKWDIEFSSYATFGISACALIGLVAFVLYVQQTGGFALDQISAKRSTLTGLEAGDSYESHGVLRFLNRFSTVALWVGVARLESRKNRRPLRGGKLWIGILFLNAILLPVYSSARSEVVWIIAVSLIIHLTIGKRRLGIAAALTIAGLVLAMVSILTQLRPGSPSAESAPSSGIFSQAVAFIGEALVYNRNFADISTSSQIINAIPNTIAYDYGQSVFAWAVAPIPRAIWPAKPITSSGPEIAAFVFGLENTAVSPGFIAESYRAFGLGSLLAFSLLLGIALCKFVDAPLRKSPASTVSLIVYCVLGFRFGGIALAGGLGYALFFSLQTAVILIVVLASCCSIGKVHRSSANFSQ